MSREMKATQVNWLRYIPKDWQLRAVKNYYPNMITGFTPPSKQDELYDDMGDIWINISDLNGTYVSNSKRHINHQYAITKHKQELTPKGSLMYAFKLSVGQTAFAACDLYTNEAIASFLPSDNVYLDFLKYSSILIVNNAQKNIYGAYLLNRDRIRNALIVFPPLSEQRQIVHFLDRKCSAIDTVVERTRDSIEKLEEYKKALITRTVTKGLDPNAKMKDSGVEWIGEIPEGWHVGKIGYFYDVTLGKMIEKNNDSSVGESYLCAANIKWDGVNTSIHRHMMFTENEKQQYLLHDGDILITEGGAAGTSCIYHNEFAPCFIQNSVNRCNGKAGYINAFLYYWMHFVSTIGYINVSCNQATIMHYTKDKVQKTPIVCVPEDEQRQIVDFLDCKCSAIDALISRKREAISKLEEYKKSLIYYAVTGKIDCRGEAI